MIDREYRLVTVFGGSGFVGRYVCEELLASDARLLVASRHPGRAHFIQPLSQVGQWGRIRADVTTGESVRKAVKGAAAVINLVGSFRNMRAVHVDGARNVAEAARDAGAKALVHISAIGADPNSPAEYGRTKGEGELAVRKAFPQATIIRPSVAFGPEDKLSNRLAAFGQLPVVPVIAPGTRFQPVFVEDLGKAIAKAALDPKSHASKTYEVAGPQVMTMRELTAAIMQAAGRNPALIDLPDFASSALSWLGFLPGAPITRDQWLMLQRDNVASEGALGLEAFELRPTPFGAVADGWLGRFRRGGRFAMRHSGQAR